MRAETITTDKANEQASSWSSNGEVLPKPVPPSPRPARMRMPWQLKTLLPVAAALLNGLLLFVLLTISLDSGPRHTVIAVATAGAFIICAIIMATLGYFVRKPMLELQKKIARVTQGDLSVSVDFADRNDEIGDLGRDFNSMVLQLRESREEIQRLHRTQMSRAEHLATLGELAAGLAHEIRNPLAGIAGVIDIIGRDLPIESPACAVVKEVKQEAMHINRILTDLLETARPKHPNFRREDLDATISHAIMFAREQATTKQVHIEFLQQKNVRPVEHDPAQIHQVLLNMLLNAIQAVAREGHIVVSLENRGDYAAISITDNGPGIPPDTLKNIFRPFFTTKGHGTGLGLSLARRMVEDHAGRIEVTSKVGEGTTFVVLLPYDRPHSEPAQS
ncbi:periplasmic sensor signal transduction histidine kinase [Candidatus Koribacter versatilis Ellin345]|uniref:histidine kinase n=1 Tax=Koribacter versatilis (strain Ellin345) TaxID=204669 RepID=Q1ITP5_KORVE|nr:HAMP domain-containing sensor histidine kinase [Candidatus Koribacter versatilis]ABF39755.1 periplasmic sensor signal transduction histidine kinase [Candidatus Koribacter versatilis Ellin345]